MTEVLVHYLAERLGSQARYPDWWMVRHLLRKECAARWRALMAGDTMRMLRDPSRVLWLSLAGLPELRRFPDEWSRRRAVRQLGMMQFESGLRRTWIVLCMLAVIAGLSGCGAGALLSTALPALATPMVVFWLRLLVSMGAFWSLLRRVQRVGAASRLRIMLLELNVAVCLGCGYSLYGHDRSAERCPECGRRIDERVREKLKSEN